ncbi:MAG: RNA polymerase sigma factor, partial [Clostridia bacterium]|nr:RNA polymerase sigma factor [Clostridia bacterium]
MESVQFDETYQTYFDPIYRYVLSLSGNPHAAEEITQETFFKALGSLDHFRGECSIKSWLCTIARNLWISDQRKKKTLPMDEALPFQDPSGG